MLRVDVSVSCKSSIIFAVASPSLQPPTARTAVDQGAARVADVPRDYPAASLPALTMELLIRLRRTKRH